MSQRSRRLLSWIAKVGVCVAVVSAWAPSASAQGLSHTIVYDVSTKGWCWLEKPATTDPKVLERVRTGKEACPEDNRMTAADFLPAGSLVHLVVVRGRFESTYSAQLTEKEIKPVAPFIRGLDDVAPAAADTKPADAKSGVAAGLFDDPATIAKGVTDLRTLHEAALVALAANPDEVFERLLGIPWTASTAPPSPGIRARRIAKFADFLQKDVEGVKTDREPYENRAQFLNFVTRTDSLVAAIGHFNELAKKAAGELQSAMEAQGAIEAYFKAARSVANDLAGAETRVAAQANAVDHRSKLAKARVDLKEYLPGGARYEEVKTKAGPFLSHIEELARLIKEINADLQAIFAAVNDLHSQSRTTDAPFEIFLGQFMKNAYVELKIKEVPDRKPYSFATDVNAFPPPKEPKPDAGAASAGEAANTRPAGGGAAASGSVDLTARAAARSAGGGGGTSGSGDGAGAATAPCPATTCCCGGCCPDKEKKEPEAPKEPEGKVIATRAFTVHQFARANVTSGFMISSLRNRQYGIEQVRAVGDDGEPASGEDGAPIFDRAPFEGDATRPQTHYYVGLNYYFKERDLFPGADGGWHPGVMVGYGINDPFNFLFGVNVETPWGVNIGGGWHIGREKFLAPGTVTRVMVKAQGGDVPAAERIVYTRLAVDATDPPTVDRRRLDGAYLNIGFDLRVFKGVFGQATAGGTPAKP